MADATTTVPATETKVVEPAADTAKRMNDAGEGEQQAKREKSEEKAPVATTTTTATEPAGTTSLLPAFSIVVLTCTLHLLQRQKMLLSPPQPLQRPPTSHLQQPPHPPNQPNQPNRNLKEATSTSLTTRLA